MEEGVAAHPGKWKIQGLRQREEAPEGEGRELYIFSHIPLSLLVLRFRSARAAQAARPPLLQAPALGMLELRAEIPVLVRT